MMDNIQINEIPETIRYINDCLNDIAKDFSIIIAYSDYTYFNKVSRAYMHENKESSNKYSIDISKKKSNDPRYIFFKCSYYNDKYNNTFTNHDEFKLNNTGEDITLDNILLKSLIFINRERKSYLD